MERAALLRMEGSALASFFGHSFSMLVVQFSLFDHLSAWLCLGDQSGIQLYRKIWERGVWSYFRVDFRIYLLVFSGIDSKLLLHILL